MHSFIRTAVANYQKCRSLKQHKFIIVQFCRLAGCPRLAQLGSLLHSHKAKIKVLTSGALMVKF